MTSDLKKQLARVICLGLDDDPDREGTRLTGYDAAAQAVLDQISSMGLVIVPAQGRPTDADVAEYSSIQAGEE